MPERKRAHSDALPTGRSCAQNTIRVNPLILTLRPPLGTATGDGRDPSAADCTDSPPHTGNEGSNTDSVLCRRAATAEEASAHTDAATPEDEAAAAAGTTAESGRGRGRARPAARTGRTTTPAALTSESLSLSISGRGDGGDCGGERTLGAGAAWAEGEDGACVGAGAGAASACACA